MISSNQTLTKEIIKEIEEQTETYYEGTFSTLTTEQTIQLAEAINNNPNITSINVFCKTWCNDNNDLIIFIRNLASNKVSGELAFTHIPFTQERAQALADYLRQDQTISTLNISHADMTVETFEVLIDDINRHPNIKKLLLTENKLKGEPGGKQIARLLAHPGCTLNDLSIALNGIGIEGIKPIAEALKSNLSLTSFNVGGNGFGDDGFAILYDALKQNQSLRKLRVSGNRLTQDSAEKMLRKENPFQRLTSLDLSRNYIGSDYCEALEKHNNTLDSPLQLNLKENGSPMIELNKKTSDKKAPSPSGCFTGLFNRLRKKSSSTVPPQEDKKLQLK